jgi:hypothetical protein
MFDWIWVCFPEKGGGGVFFCLFFDFGVWQDRLGAYRLDLNFVVQVVHSSSFRNAVVWRAFEFCSLAH